jgi:hypothetical protein
MRRRLPNRNLATFRRKLQDLRSVGDATMWDFEVLGIGSVEQRAGCKPDALHLPVWEAFGNLEVLHQCAHRGFGISMLPTYVGDSDPRVRRLSTSRLPSRGRYLAADAPRPTHKF